MSEKNMKGVVVFFINHNPDIEGVSFGDQIRLFKELNAEFIQKLEEESHYRVAIVPATKEACRVEKVDFEHPFPRFVPNNVDIKENEQNKLLIKQIMEKRYKSDEDDD